MGEIMKYKGTIEELKSLITSAGVSIDNDSDHGNFHQVKIVGGAIINWYPTTGTVQFQGKAEAKAKLQKIWSLS